MSQIVFPKTKEVPTSLDSFPTRHFSVEEYHRMAEVGILAEDERVELIGGRILRMSPIGSQHAAYVSFLNRKLRAIEETAIVRIQDPIIVYLLRCLSLNPLARLLRHSLPTIE